MQSVINYICSPRQLFLAIVKKTNFLYSDAVYLRLVYSLMMKKSLHLKNPVTFNEKLQWLKLYDRNPQYTTMVDKCEAKKYVASVIGDKYIIPTLGVWNRVEEIDFDRLPDKFVLKTTHDGGGEGVVICRDKKQFDKQAALSKLSYSMQRDIYALTKEWPYRNVTPRIIAEEYLADGHGDLDDYKFFCFDGNVYCVMVCVDRNIGSPKFYFFDRAWSLLRLNKRGKEAPEGFTLPKPRGIDEMFELAGRLSTGIPFVRVDLYNQDGVIWFGEMTFYPASGFDANLLDETDLLLGSMINLKN